MQFTQQKNKVRGTKLRAIFQWCSNFSKEYLLPLFVKKNTSFLRKERLQLPMFRHRTHN